MRSLRNESELFELLRELDTLDPFVERISFDDDVSFPRLEPLALVPVFAELAPLDELLESPYAELVLLEVPALSVLPGSIAVE